MGRKLELLRDLSPGEALMLPALALLSFVCRLALSLASVESVARVFGRARRLSPLGRRAAPGRIFRLADWASRLTHGRRGCLPRSLLLLALLPAGGDPPRLVLGVLKSGGGLEGHAWVERAGAPPDGGAGAGRFQEMLRLERA